MYGTLLYAMIPWERLAAPLWASVYLVQGSRTRYLKATFLAFVCFARWVPMVAGRLIFPLGAAPWL